MSQSLTDLQENHVALQSSLGSMEAFAHAASHDLRTPLNTVMGLIELFEDQYAARDAEIVYVTGSGLFRKGELFELAGNVRWVLRQPVRVSELAEMIDHVVQSRQPTQRHLSAAS